MTTSQNPENETPDPTPAQSGAPVRVAAGRVTREVDIRELKARASEVIERIAEGERAVVTRHGRPVAVVLSIEESLEFALAHAEEFIQARRHAHEDLVGSPDGL